MHQPPRPFGRLLIAPTHARIRARAVLIARPGRCTARFVLLIFHRSLPGRRLDQRWLGHIFEYRLWRLLIPVHHAPELQHVVHIGRDNALRKCWRIWWNIEATFEQLTFGGWGNSESSTLHISARRWRACSWLRVILLKYVSVRRQVQYELMFSREPCSVWDRNRNVYIVLNDGIFWWGTFGIRFHLILFGL